MRTFHLSITQDDIDHGMSGDRGHCPIARRIAHEIPEARFIKVDRDKIAFTDVNTRLRYFMRTPRAAQQFVDDCDLYGRASVRPFDLVLGHKDLYETKIMKARPPRRVGEGTIDNTPANDAPKRNRNGRFEGGGLAA